MGRVKQPEPTKTTKTTMIMNYNQEDTYQTDEN